MKIFGLMGKMAVLALALGLTVGCAAKKRVEGDVPVPKPTVKDDVKAKGDSYTVKPGNTLWGISGSSKGYSDPFQWPLLYKNNRDQIQDPDLIYPDQKLKVDRNVSAEEKAKARKKASDTPKHVPHSKPRETMPVNYF